MKKSLVYMKTSESILKQANKLNLIEDDDSREIKALTFNNLGCYYKK